MPATTQQMLTELNYRLADVLVYIKGYRSGIEANPQGNQAARKAQLDLCQWVEKHLTDSKTTIAHELSKES